MRKFPGSDLGRLMLCWALLAAAIIILSNKYSMAAQNTEAPPQKQISGLIKSGDIPLPGVSVSAVNPVTGHQFITSTDENGGYTISVPDAGQYKVNAQMTAFANAARDVSIDDAHPSAHVDFQLTLQSRAQAPRPARPGPGEIQNPGNRAPGQNRREARNEPGFLNLPVIEGETAMGGVPGAEEHGAAESGQPPPGDVAAESVAVSGTTARMGDLGNLPEFRQLGIQLPGQYGQFPGGPGGFAGGPPGGGGPGGGFAGGGPGGGGFVILRGGGGGPGFGGRGGRRNFNRIRGNISETLEISALDASPFSLSGQQIPKPSYVKNRYSVALGGPLNIPKVFHGGTSTFFFLSYDGTRGQSLYDAFSTVPTAAERSGDLSGAVNRNGPSAGLPVTIVDPLNGQSFSGNVIPSFRINPAAAGLLQYIPLPNLPGTTQNFQFVEPVDSNVDNLNIRVVHTFARAGGGNRRGPGGRFGRQSSNVNFGFHFQNSGSQVTNPFPAAGGNTSSRSMDIPAGYTLMRGRLVNTLRVDFNRSRITTQNLYAYNQNIAGQLGILGVSQNPFDWGLPNLSLTNFSGLTNVSPRLERDQTYTITDQIIWNHGAHTWRWGGDFRRLQVNPQTSSNARGSFIFTGINTGYDFADFLLGLPQQTSAQFGVNAYYFRGNSWDTYGQDEWRLKSNLTLNLGVRYEYVSPFSEKYNRIVNLAAAPGFVSVAPVQPGQAGPFGMTFPATLVNPDRLAFAPRVGLAWRPRGNTVVRAGYGVNYNTGAYKSIVQNLAFQPPFSFTQTNIESPSLPLTLQDGFPPAPAAVTNNYGVDPNYRMPYVQIWNFNFQQELPGSLLLNLDYTGTKGTDLDMLRAPNRGPAGLLIPGVQPFLWESSEGDSVMHALAVRLRRRFRGGFNAGATYVFSKSIDNASSIGGGGTVVAQNDLDLAAERGLSSFDQRQKLTGDYIWEFPLGTDKRWLSTKGRLSNVLAGWQVSGSFTLASGLPFTANVLGNFADVSRGTNGTLRADATGLPAEIGNPTTGEFFNTAAFVLPTAGQFGDAGRNTVIGPHTLVFNMALAKVIHLGDVRSLELRGQASNVFNTPQFTSISTTVNSPTYGQVTAVGAMRTMQIVARFRF